MKLRKLKTALIIIAALFSFHTVQAGQEEILKILAAIKYTEDSKFGVDSIETVQQYSLYREFYKQKNYTDALNHWRYIFFNAPNFMETTHQNGAVLYQSIIKDLPREEWEPYVDTLLAIYDARLKFYGDKGDVIGRKAYDAYRFRNSETELVLGLFKKSLDISGESFLYSFYGPYIRTAVKADKSELITNDQVLELFSTLSDLADANIAKGNKPESYESTMNDVMDHLFKEDYFQCDKLLPIAERKYNANPDDEGNLKKLYSQLKNAKCTSDPVFIKIATSLNEKSPTPSVCRFLAQKQMEFDNTEQTVALYNQAADLEDDATQKASDYLNIAKLYRQKSQFSNSRQYARKAAEYRPDWGQPYILIGKLYASSGKLCGPGTGWDSQVVTWAAIDMFQKAKSLDTESAEEAQALISKYWQYMPNTSDIFMRSLKKGGSYSIGCWIGESTTIRASD